MKILIPVDGSEYSKRAAEYVASQPDLLRGSDATLHLLHVMPPIATPRARAFLGSDVVNNYYKEESEEALEPAETILRGKNIPFQSCYLVGDVAERIREYADKHAIDMIVMGSHGNGAFRNLVMGSVATKVLAATTIPVLIIR